MDARKFPVAADRPWFWGAVIAGGLLIAYVSLPDTADGGKVAADATLSAASSARPSSVSSELSLVPVKSWEGTEVAGDVRLDGAGNIIPDRALLELFDYVRSAVGEIDTPQMHAHLLDIGRQRQLTAAQRAALDGLFGKYLDYLHAVSGIKTESSDIGSLRKTYEARYWMRREMLGFAMAEAFFSGSEAEDRFTLDRMEILADKGLTDAQRSQRLTALSAAEPAERRAALQPSQNLLDLSNKTEQMRQAGASVEQIQAMRVGLVGSEAAERLKALDQEQADWARRMQALEAGRRNVLLDSNIPAYDKQMRINELVLRDFSGPEALRARAILGMTDTLR